MKKILTHFFAFILGIVSLPVIIFATLQISPSTLPTLIGYVINSTGPSEIGIEALRQAQNEEERFYALGDAAKEAFNIEDYVAAEKYANQLAELIPMYKTNWNYGNAIQDCNLILGRIALKNGKVEEAKQYLIKAGKSPGSPQMDTFGPNMSLAKDLLEAGEYEVVIEYFSLCKIFWEMHDGRLDEWTVLVKAGKIPNFGANLVY